MLQARFDCAVLTPMFLGGIAPNETAEVRVPSIRGGMRWWYRALLAGRGHDLEALRNEEANVFGSTEQTSSVRMRIARKKVNVEKYDKIKKLRGNTGTDYLWHFVKAGENERRYLAPYSSFQLVCSAFPGQKKELEEAVRALWLLTFLGGLGTRSRRMAGAFTVTVADQSEALDLPAFAPQRGFDTWFGRELKQIVPSDASSPDALLEEKGLPILHPAYAQVRRLSSKKSWESAVETFGEGYKKYRNERKKQYKVHFGLPLATGKRGKEEVKVKGGKDDLGGDGQLGRRASPIWLQAVKFASGNVAALITAFQSALAPPVVRVGKRGEPATQTPRSVATDFFNEVDARSSYLE